MIGIWLCLFLGTLVHLLALNGYGFERVVAVLPLLPVAGCFLMPLLHKRAPRLFGPVHLRIAGLLGLAGTLLLARLLLLAGWDVRDPLPDALAALGGLGSLWVLTRPGGTAIPGAPHWLWIAFWLMAGFLDPALPLVGAGLAGALEGFGWWPQDASRPPMTPPLAWPGLAFFLMGLALPKPWWDFGPRPEWAFAGASLGVGAALASAGLLPRSLAQVPGPVITLGIGLLAILYGPSYLVVWGALLGLLMALAWQRTLRPFDLPALGGAWLLGLVVSFVLHSNVWLPGLRHLIWLGN